MFTGAIISVALVNNVYGTLLFLNFKIISLKPWFCKKKLHLMSAECLIRLAFPPNNTLKGP